MSEANETAPENDGLSPVETFDAAGWRKQALQFKRELDSLNPCLSARNTRIVELETELAKAREVWAEQNRTIGKLRDELAIAVKNLDAECKARGDVQAELGKANDEYARAIAEAGNKIVALTASNARLTRCLQQTAKRAGEIVADVAQECAGAE